MALTDETGGMNTTMLVSPTGGYAGNGFGGLDSGNGWWIILLFILLVSGGWNNGFGNGGAMPFIAGETAGSGSVQRGFDQAAIMGGINGVQSEVNGISNQLCNGFAGTTAAITGAQNAITQQMYNGTIADLQQSFALQSQLAQCCCDNRAATADLKYTVATEACADRNAIASALRDVISATQAQTQTILDKMCQQEIDALKSQNIALQNQLNLQSLAASQTAQTAQLIADNTAQTQYIVNRVAPYPIPAYTVANPNTPTT